MKTSEHLYGELDAETAEIQKKLFTRKKMKAWALIAKLKPSFNVGSFTPEQRELEYRMDDIKKAIEFCDAQIAEAEEVLNEL